MTHRLKKGHHWIIVQPDGEVYIDNTYNCSAYREGQRRSFRAGCGHHIITPGHTDFDQCLCYYQGNDVICKMNLPQDCGECFELDQIERYVSSKLPRFEVQTYKTYGIKVSADTLALTTNVELWKYWWDTSTEDIRDIILSRGGVACNNIDVHKYWWSKVLEHGYVTKVRSISFNYYSKKGYVNVLQWFYNLHLEHGINIHKLPDFRVYSDEPGIYYSSSAIHNVVTEACVRDMPNETAIAVLDWWLTHIPDVFENKPWECSVYIRQASMSGNIDLLNWFYGKRGTLLFHLVSTNDVYCDSVNQWYADKYIDR